MTIQYFWSDQGCLYVLCTSTFWTTRNTLILIYIASWSGWVAFLLHPRSLNFLTPNCETVCCKRPRLLNVSKVGVVNSLLVGLALHFCAARLFASNIKKLLLLQVPQIQAIRGSYIKSSPKNLLCPERRG